MRKNNQPGADKPNIVYIMADDMGYGDVACYNPDSKIPTPNMDRLAEEGMMFTDAHSSAAICTPSRYSVITGRYCWRTRLKRGIISGYATPLIEKDRLTIAGILKKAGYNTACFGKWHLGLGFSAKAGDYVEFDKEYKINIFPREVEEKIDFAAGVKGGPTELGFDYFFGTSATPNCQPPYAFIENDRFVKLPEVYCDSPLYTCRPGFMDEDWDPKNTDPMFTKKAEEYIEKQKDCDKPFFIYLASSAPHEPCLEEVVPDFAKGKANAGYRGDLVWLFDWMVGRVMDVLERTGQADNTLIFVTSDNGALPGDKFPNHKGDLGNYNLYGHKSCGDWKGYKSHSWEGGHREPLIVKWPDVIKPGSVSDEMLCLSDIMATCAAIAGVAIPEGAAEDSYNMLPVLLQVNYTPIRKDIIHHSGRGVFSIRKGIWKLITDSMCSEGVPYLGQSEDMKCETPGLLYNIFQDPQEKINLYSSYPEIVKELTELLEGYKAAGHSVPSV